MHLPLLHISSRVPSRDEDPLRLGKFEGRDWLPWLADPVAAVDRACKRTRLLDIASLSLAAVGSEISYFGLMAGLFGMYNRKTALQMAAVILPSVTLNQVIKSRFKFKRPPTIAMHPQAFVAPGDFTFPSGHAQNAVTLGLFIAQRARRPWVKLTGLGIAVAIPLSRVYLGVHYPRDVLAGALLGMGSLAGTNLLEKPFRRWWKSRPRGPRGFAVALVCIIIGLLSGAPLAAYPLALGGGIALGHDISGHLRFQMDRPSPRRRFAQGLIGTLLFIGTGVATRPLLKRQTTSAASLAGILVGLALTFAVPVVTRLAYALHYARRRLREKKKKGGG